MMFILQVLQVFEVGEGLSMLEIENTTERTIVDGLEISISAEGRVMLVNLLVVLPHSENLVGVGWITNGLLHCVGVDHFSFN